jgi:hypothetical protein
MKREGPKNIVIPDGDIITVTIEGPDIANHYPNCRDVLLHTGMGSFNEMPAWLQHFEKLRRHPKQGTFQKELVLPVILSYS